MSTDEDYFPSDGSSCRLRRSKRVTRHDVRKAEEKKLRKSLDRAEKKAAAARKEKKLAEKKKRKTQDAGEEKEAYKFSGEALTPAELQQLWMKFTRDGHFRCEPSVSSSRQSEDARGGGKKNRSDAKRATATSEKASTEDNVDRSSSDKQDLLSVTLSNPLPNASGSTMHISASRGQCAAAFPSERHKSWTGPIICRNFLPSGNCRPGNSIDLSSNESAFSPVARKPYQRASIANTRRPAFEASPSSAWKSYEKSNSEQSNNRNEANSRGFYCHGNNSQVGHGDNSTIAQGDRANREHLGSAYSNVTKLPPLQVRPSNYCGNFDQTGSAPAFQSRQTSLANSSFVVANQSSYSNANWNEIDFNIANIFSNDNPSMNDGFDLQNTVDHASPGFRPYNPEIQGSNNVYPQAFGDNVNSMIDYGSKLSGHHLSLMAWNSLQVYQNPYSTGNELSYVNNFNCSIPYDGSISSMIVNEPSNLIDPAGYWQQKNSLNRGFYANDPAVRANTTIDTSNSTNVIPVTSTTTAADESLPIARINDKEIDRGNFDFDDFPDSQDGDFCPTVSSICSYDDDIGYENYIEDSLVNNNSVSKTSNMDLLRNLKAEARPTCDGRTNYSQRNVNDPRRRDGNSLYHDFGSKEKVTETPDCIILENSPRA